MAETFHIMGAPSIRSSSPPAQLFINSRFGCFSSSTVAVTGDEEVVNGTFTTDTSDWAATDCTIAAIDGGKSGKCLEITRTGGDVQKATQTLTLELNRLYRVTAYTKRGTSGAEFGTIRILDAADDSEIYSITATAAADWAETPDLLGNFRAWVASVKIVVEKSSATAGTMLFDTVTVKEFVPAYVNADIAAPDGWMKSSTLSIYRQVATTDVDGSAQYSCKLVPTAVNDYLQYNPLGDVSVEQFRAAFRDSDMVFKATFKTSTASHARLKMSDGVTTWYSKYHTGGGGWEDLEVAGAFSTSLTKAEFIIECVLASGDVYVCKPMLSYGKVIGDGNWQPIPSEMVIINAPQQSLVLGGTVACSDISSGAHLDLEADSYGVIPRGISRVYARANVNDSGSATGAAWLKLRHHGAGGNDWHCVWSCGGLANDAVFYGGMQWCLVNLGAIEYVTEATGPGTLDVSGLFYCAVGY